MGTAIEPAEATARGLAAMAAGAGAVAAAIALGTGELAAGAVSGWQSLVVSVGHGVITTTPGDAARAGIEIAGSANKPLIISATVLVSLALGAAAGVASLRWRWAGAATFGFFGALGAFAGIRDELASDAGAVVTAALAATAGAAALYGLLAVAEGRRGEWLALLWGQQLAAPPPPISAGNQVSEHPTNPEATRRAFLGWAGAGGIVALGATGAGRALAGRSRVESMREAVVLAGDVEMGPASLPSGLEAEVEGLTPLVVPDGEFYRIDTRLSTPQIDPNGWSLSIGGMVDRPYTLSYDELLSLATDDFDVTLACVSNEVGGPLVGNARWRGVPLAALLERAGVQAGAGQVVGRSVDGWTAGFPTEVALDGRPAIVAVGMNGEPLPFAHGFPARLVVAGLYGYVSATKWLEEIKLTTWDGFDAYWIDRGWSKKGPIKTQSRIDVPRSGQRIPPGVSPVAGVAWAGERGVERVEVQVDEGEWLEATLGEELAQTSWRQWVLQWDATPGPHTLRVRATDGDGATQTSDVAPPEPDGATGWHTIRVSVGD